MAIAVKSFFPSSRMHRADVSALHEGHREAPLFCSLDTNLHISLVGGTFHPILRRYREPDRRSRHPQGYDFLLDVDDDANTLESPAA